MAFAKDDEVVQAFLLHGLDESLDEGHRVRRAVRRLLNSQVGVLQRLVEVLGELAVPVVHHDVRFQATSLDVLHESLGLLSNPDFARLERGRRDEHAAAFHVQEDEHEDVA